MSTVLVIDDSRAVRAYVHELLAGEHEVLDAPDGRAGLEVIRQTPPDLVLLDIEMPGMNGLDLLGMLDPGRLFTVILFTTRSSIDSIVAGLERGADDYIVKPFQPEEFRARVTAGLRTARRKRELDEARRTAEDALHRLEESERLCLARERMMAIASLASGAAHQINNPLGFITSNVSVLGRYSQTLLQTIDELSAMVPDAQHLASRRDVVKISADIPELIAETLQGLRRITRIVKGLSQLQPAMQYVERQRVDLSVVLDALVEVKSRALPEGVRIVRHDLSPNVMVDVALPLVDVAFDALLTNAVEAVQEGEIVVTLKRDGEWGVVSISNPSSLSGVDPSRFLEPFVGTKSLDEHAGLGLPVAERFVVSQGGELSLHVTPHGEFVATVRLPLVDS